MLTTITELFEQNRKQYAARRETIEQRAMELNAGTARSKYARDGMSVQVEPTWDSEDRPHAPFDGYLWEGPNGIEAYGGGQYLPFVDEFDSFDKPDYAGDNGWWKLRLTEAMYKELKSSNLPIDIQSAYKVWSVGETKVGMYKVRTHKCVLKAIQEHSEHVFNDMYTELNKNKGIAPEGKVTIVGTVVSVKTYEGFYGVETKMLVKLENGATVYGSLPKAVNLEYRGMLEFKATFEHSKDDNTHAFFKRPSSVELKC